MRPLRPEGIDLGEGIDSDALEYAFSRIEDFIAVHQHREGESQLQAVGLLQSSVGLEQPHREMLAEWITKNLPSLGESQGALLLGLIMGLFVMEHEYNP